MPCVATGLPHMHQIPMIFVLSAAAAGIAAIGFVVARRVLKPIDLEQHHGFMDAMLSIVGTLVSILLGLLVAAALDHYREIEMTVDSEAANVSEMYRLTMGLPVDTRLRVRKLLIDYCQEVVNDEWPAMAHGKTSPKVLFTYVKLVGEVVTFRPADDGETNIHAALIQSVQQVGDDRRKRVLVLDSQWSRQLMPMLMMCSAMVLIFAYLYVRQGQLFHGVIICLVAVALGGNLGLVYLLSNPFSSEWKIMPRGFELNLQLQKDVNALPGIQHILQGTREEMQKELKLHSDDDKKFNRAW